MSDRDTHRAERDTEILYWLGKKALEYRTQHDTVRADVIDLMASKISRGAVRPDNTLLPNGVTAGFFQPGHTYTDPNPTEYDWQFRCDAVTVHPGTGERTALGWVWGLDGWESCAYAEDDWELHLHVGTTVRPTEGGEQA
jgi:hypothetical protein